MFCAISTTSFSEASTMAMGHLGNVLRHLHHLLFRSLHHGHPDRMCSHPSSIPIAATSPKLLRGRPQRLLVLLVTQLLKHLPHSSPVSTTWLVEVFLGEPPSNAANVQLFLLDKAEGDLPRHGGVIGVLLLDETSWSNHSSPLASLDS